MATAQPGPCPPLRRDRRLLWLMGLSALFVALCLGLAGPLAPPTRAANQSVSITNFSFSPNVVTVNIGESVTWTNVSGFHTSTSSSVPGGAQGWDSGQLNTSSPPFTHTFTVPGTYSYICSNHASMTGQVIVNPAGPTSTRTATVVSTDTRTPTVTVAPTETRTPTETIDPTFLPTNTATATAPALDEEVYAPLVANGSAPTP